MELGGAERAVAGSGRPAAIAIHVEDHPIDYADFQGRIPDGQYGAGAVETWDRGTWQPIGDPEEGLRRGDLRFVLAGRRLHGRFTLVASSRRDPRKPEDWFLIKGDDASAREGVDALALEAEAAAPKPAATRRPKKSPLAPGAMRGKLPDAQQPQLGAVAENPPEGDGWISEIKFDGYRLLAAVEDGSVRLLTRNGLDWADRLPAVAARIAALPVTTALLDGELVSLEAGRRLELPGAPGGAEGWA